MTKFYQFIRSYLAVFLMLGAVAAFAQERTVSGKVTSSEDGSPLPGVNILEKGTTNGSDGGDATSNSNIALFAIALAK